VQDQGSPLGEHDTEDRADDRQERQPRIEICPLIEFDRTTPRDPGDELSRVAKGRLGDADVVDRCDVESGGGDDEASERDIDEAVGDGEPVGEPEDGVETEPVGGGRDRSGVGGAQT
jgi:hypothetical protein